MVSIGDGMRKFGEVSIIAGPADITARNQTHARTAKELYELL